MSLDEQSVVVLYGAKYSADALQSLIMSKDLTTKIGAPLRFELGKKRFRKLDSFYNDLSANVYSSLNFAFGEWAGNFDPFKKFHWRVEYYNEQPGVGRLSCIFPACDSPNSLNVRSVADILLSICTCSYGIGTVIDVRRGPWFFIRDAGIFDFDKPSETDDGLALKSGWLLDQKEAEQDRRYNHGLLRDLYNLNILNSTQLSCIQRLCNEETLELLSLNSVGSNKNSMYILEVTKSNLVILKKQLFSAGLMITDEYLDGLA